MNTENYKYHIISSEKMTLKDLTELLKLINLSINDYYRDNGIGNRDISLYAPAVNEVEKGSICIDIAISVFSSVTASLLAEYILHRIRQARCKDESNIRIEAGNNNVIHINVNR